MAVDVSGKRLGDNAPANPKISIQRSIYFFEAKIEGCDNMGKPLVFSAHHFGKLLHSVANSGDFYHQYDNGDRLSVWVEETSSHDWQITFGKTRRSALPHLERHHDKIPLILDDDTGVLEQIHVVIFTDGIVGAEYNTYAPRLHALSEFVHSKVPDSPLVLFEPLFSKDTWKRLNDVSEVKWFKFSFGEKSGEILKDTAIGGLSGVFRGLLNGHEAPGFDVIIRAPKRSRKMMPRNMLNRVLDLFADSRVMATAETVQLEGYSDRTHHREFFDLLRDQVMVKRLVVRQHDDHKAIDSNDMFAKIREARVALDDAIRDATERKP